MPLPTFIVIPDDMGSNILEGSTVPGALASDALHWVATIQRGAGYNDQIYPVAAVGADAADALINNSDEFVTTPLFVQQAITAAINAIPAGVDVKVQSVAYNSVTRVLRVTQTDTSFFDVTLPVATAGISGLVKLLTSSQAASAPTDDVNAATPKLVNQMITAAITAALASLVDSDDQTADEVSVTDASNYFVGTTVEAVLDEIGAQVHAPVVLGSANGSVSITPTGQTFDLAVSAASTPLVDAGNNYTATNVEDALAEVAANNHDPVTVASTTLTFSLVDQALTIDAVQATGAVAGIVALATEAAYVPTSDTTAVTPAALEARIESLIPTIPPVVLAERTGSQTLAAGVWTKGNFPVEVEDSEAVYNPATSRFTFTRSGIYYFSAQSSFGSGTDLPTTGIRVYKNGSFKVIGSQSTAETNGTAQIASGMIKINAGDYIEIFLYKGSNIAGDYNANYGAVQSFYIRPL